MDIKELKSLIDATIYPNGEKKIKASSHQSMLHEIVDYTDENINTINEGLEEVKSTLETQGGDVEQLKESSKQTELNDAKVNQKIDNLASNIVGLGGDIKGSAKGADVIELPSVAINGVAPGYTIGGLTIQNLVENGDFSDGLENWNLRGAGRIDIEGNVCKITLVSDGSAGLDYINKLGNKGDVVYATFLVKLSKDGKAVARFDLSTPYTQEAKRCVVTRISNILVVSGSSELKLGIYGIDNEGDWCDVSSVVAINLTQLFGAGNEPTKEWCDKHIKGYIDGVQSVQTPLRVKSVGENKVGRCNIVYDKYRWSEGDVTYQKLPNVTEKFAVLNTSGVSYFSYMGKRGGNSSRLFIRYSDGTRDGISVWLPTEFGRVGFNIDPKKTIVEIGITYSSGVSDWSYIDIDSMYLGIGDKYVGYESITSYINSQTTLRSLPKIKDYIKNDKLYKNIKRHYFTKEDNWTLRDDYEGDNFRYYMTLPFEYKTSGSGVEGELFCNNYTATSNVASVLTEIDSNTIALYRENTSTVYLTLDKKVDDVNSVIPKGTFIDVILPETEQVKLDTSGVVTTKPNGTIFIENIKNVTDFYTANGLDVKDFKELVSIYKYEGSDLIQLDASKAVFTTTLKHPDLTDGDLVFFEYKYLDSPLWGDNEIEYFNKNNVLQSENGKLWQKVEKASNEGVLTTELKEIV